MKLARMGVVAGAVAILLPGAARAGGAGAGSKCALSSECSGDLVCIDYKCATPPKAGAPRAAATVVEPSPPPAPVSVPSSKQLRVPPPPPVPVPPPPTQGTGFASLWGCAPNDDVACDAALHRVCKADGTGWGECVPGQPPAESPQRLEDKAPLNEQHVAALEPYSSGMKAGGVTLIVFGSLAIACGIGFMVTTVAESNSDNPDTFPTGLTFGLLIGGGISLAAGIALDVVGAHDVPRLQPPGAANGEPRLKIGSLTLSPSLGPGSGGIHGSF